jgi:hypothetical protein
VRLQLVERNVVADAHVANIVEAWGERKLFKRVLAVLHIRVVWRDAEPNEAIRYGKLFIHVDDGILNLADQTIRRVETCGARANDSNAQTVARCR